MTTRYPLTDPLGRRLPVDLERTVVTDEQGNTRYIDRYVWNDKTPVTNTTGKPQVGGE